MEAMPVWESLAKRLIWRQLSFLRQKELLDFGSGNGATASHFAKANHVTAVEPSEEMLQNAVREHPYRQCTGSLQVLKGFPDGSFDAVLCHNVLEYMEDQEKAVKEFSRILKPGGILSIVKHNLPGRVMQMAVLLNDFEAANALLDGKPGSSRQFGAIRYYKDSDLERWGAGLRPAKTYGLRTFWDLQQNQEVQAQPQWQEDMLRLEERVGVLPEFQEISFFHHILLRKEA